MENKVYKPYTKKFFNEEGRFINANGFEWLVCKDMFNWLGRVKSDGTWTNEKNKMDTFLKNIDKIEYHKSLVVLLKQGKTKVEKEVDCIRIDIVPMVLTQFEPTKRAGEEKHQQWCELMKFINNILMELEVYKFITVDKDYQKDCMTRLQKIKGDVTQKDFILVNKDIARVMGELVKVDIPLYKNDLKEYMNQTTVDLLKVREESLDAYLNFYELFQNYKDAYESTLKVMNNRYK